MTAWLYRGVGAAMVLFAGKTYLSADAELMTAPGAWALHLFCAVGAAMVALGGRRLLLAAATLSALRCVVSNHRPDEPLSWFPAAEWPLFVALPLGGLLLATDPGVAAWFRWAGSTSLAFTGLHKLNTDWFDPVVTCHRLSERLHSWWGLPEALPQAIEPWMVVVAELGTPLLLWWRPRVGALVAAALLAHFVAIGATALSWLLLVTVVAFQEEESIDRFFRVVYAVPGIGAMGLSWVLWNGPWSWMQYGVTYALFGWTGAWMLGELLRDGTGRHAAFAPERRGVLGAAVLLWLLNGLAPYSGLKFQYSFAMLSNLRVDDDRHNSLLFPRWMRWADDPYVHVDAARYRDASSGRVLSGGEVVADLYTPHELVVQGEVARSVGEVLEWSGRWRGRRVTHADVHTLPPARLFRDRLTKGAPQQCVH